MQSVKLQAAYSQLGTTILLAQPFFTFPIFLSVLIGAPPLGLSWLIALIPWPLRYVITGRLTCRTPFDIPILIFTAGMLLGFIISPDLKMSLPVLHTYLACVLLYYGIVNNSRARLRYWIFIGVLLTLILLFLSVWVFANGGGRQVVFNSWVYELASSLSWSPSMVPNLHVLGGAFAVVIPGLVAIALFRQRAWIRWSAGILAVIFGGILVLSTSGSGWIAAIAGILMVLLYRSAKTFWGTFLVLVAVTAASFPIWHNASWIGRVFSSQSLFGRQEYWQATIAALKDHPLTGLGLGGWWSELPSYPPPGGPHNAYLQLYSDTGALGFIALVIAVIIGIKLLWQIMRSDKDSPSYGIGVGITAGIVAGGVYALVEVNTNVLIPIDGEYIYFAVPLLWLWAALFVVSCKHLLGRSANGN